MTIIEPRMDFHFTSANDIYNAQVDFYSMKRRVQSNYENDALMEENEKQQKEIELLRKMLMGKLN